jgi:predicted transcriptional regulator
MVVKRKREQMFSDFLSVAKGGNLRKTEFYCKFGSSHRYFKYFLGIALNEGFISIDKDVYNLTGKGAKLSEELKNYKRVKQKAGEMVEQAEKLKNEILKKYRIERL